MLFLGIQETEIVDDDASDHLSRYREGDGGARADLGDQEAVHEHVGGTEDPSRKHPRGYAAFPYRPDVSGKSSDGICRGQDAGSDGEGYERRLQSGSETHTQMSVYGRLYCHHGPYRSPEYAPQNVPCGEPFSGLSPVAVPQGHDRRHPRSHHEQAQRTDACQGTYFRTEQSEVVDGGARHEHPRQGQHDRPHRPHLPVQDDEREHYRGPAYSAGVRPPRSGTAVRRQATSRENAQCQEEYESDRERYEGCGEGGADALPEVRVDGGLYENHHPCQDAEDGKKRRVHIHTSAANGRGDEPP